MTHRSGLTLILLFTPLLVTAQGPITPADAPAPVMKTLTQIEPRTGVTNLPYTISTHGSYYLESSLSSTGHGITVQSENVTIDLNGFTMEGNRSGGYYGLYIRGVTNDSLANVTIQNGIIRDFDYGIHAEYATANRYSGLMIDSSLNDGIRLNGMAASCNQNVIEDCRISSSGSEGIHLFADGGECNENTIQGCVVTGSGTRGILIEGIFGTCAGNVITDCMIANNGDAGIRIGGAQFGDAHGNIVRNSTISGNFGQGIQLYGYQGKCIGNTLDNCNVTENGSTAIFLYGREGACNGNEIRNCRLSDNSGFGFYLDGAPGQCDGNTIVDCQVIESGGYGAYLNGSSGGSCKENLIKNCRLWGNAIYGIFADQAHANRIENNLISGTTGSGERGIYTSLTTDNMILGNTCIGQGTNYLLSATDIYGPIATNTGALPATGDAAHPWANFSR